MKINYNPAVYLNRDLFSDELGSAAATTQASSLSNGNTLGAISAGSGLVGGVIDAITANSRAHQAMAFSQQQANTQRQWALQDRNFALSDAPSMAMAGFKKAGLNPNLIYSQATNSPTVRSTPEAQYTPAQPSIGKAIGEAIPRYQNAKIAAVQTDNAALIGQNLIQENLNQQAELVRKNMANNVLSTQPGATHITADKDNPYYITEPDGSKTYYNDSMEYVRAMNMRGQQESLSNMWARNQNQYMQNESQRMSNALQSATQSANITIGLQKGIQALIDTSKDGIERDNLRIIQHGLIQDNDLKQAEIALRSGTFDSRSPVIQTFLRTLLDAAIIFAK